MRDGTWTNTNCHTAPSPSPSLLTPRRKPPRPSEASSTVPRLLCPLPSPPTLHLATTLPDTPLPALAGASLLTPPPLPSPPQPRPSPSLKTTARTCKRCLLAKERLPNRLDPGIGWSHVLASLLILTSAAFHV